LTDSHRCPRRPFVVAVEVVLAAVVGGFAGLLLAAIFDPQGRMDPLFFVGGALVGATITRIIHY
jgi:hypothetical protein